MRIAVILFTLLAAAAVDAGTKQGVTMPDTITAGGQQLQLNGMGLREATIFKVDVYVAGLYVAHPTSDPGRILADDEPKVMTLHFVRDVGKDDIVKAWNEGFAHNIQASRQDIDRLNAWMPSFKKGDNLVFSYMPGKGVTVSINGAVKGTIAEPGFARALFAIWVGPRPPTAELKRGLLGSHRA